MAETVTEKHTKATVGYVDRAADPHERCAKCVNFRPLYDRCAKVAGSINPKGWCRLFERKAVAKAAA